jgi:hypothetical protein
VGVIFHCAVQLATVQDLIALKLLDITIDYCAIAVSRLWVPAIVFPRYNGIAAHCPSLETDSKLSLHRGAPREGISSTEGQDVSGSWRYHGKLYGAISRCQLTDRHRYMRIHCLKKSGWTSETTCMATLTPLLRPRSTRAVVSNRSGCVPCNS